MNLQGSDDGQNLDPLLDTMANVVGILIVVLAVAQLTVGEAVNRITEQEALRTEREDATSAQRLDSLEQRWQATAPLLWETRREIERLNARLGETATESQSTTTSAAVNLSSQNAAVAAKALRAQDLRDEVAAARDKISALQIQLQDESAENALAIASVRLPDPRPAPPAATPTTFVCRYGRILRVDLRTLEQSLVQTLSQLGAMGSRGVTAGDYSRITRHFASQSIGDSDFRWSLFDRGRNGLIARLTWRQEDRGEAFDDLSLGASRFQYELRRNSPNRTYLHFHVWSDSFRTYLEARRIAEELGFSAGWSAYSPEAELEANLTDMRRRLDNPLPID